jgi:hypothetical protein
LTFDLATSAEIHWHALLDRRRSDLVALSLSAQAASSTGVTDSPLFKPTTTTQPLLLAQRHENPGGDMYKKSKKKKKK